jgi:spoIIIJ-associated protein
LKTERFEATSVDAAVAKGLQQLRLSREDVEVQVIQEAKKGFLGLGAKDAIVDIHYTEPEKPEINVTTDDALNFSHLNQEKTSSSVEPSEDIDEQATEPVENDHQQIDVEPETAETETANEAIETEPELDEEPTNHNAAIEEAVAEADDSEDSEEATEAKSESVAETETPKEVEEPVQEEESLELVDDDFKDVEFVAEYLIDVLDAYLVDATIEVEDRGRTVIYNIQTDKKGLVIGKHGKIINSLETLAQMMTHQHVRPHVKVIVNVGNYRERRQETLARLARKTADQVSKSKQPVFLDPLPAAERKIIHAQLARYSYIATHSEGKEPHRYLVVSYKD